MITVIIKSLVTFFAIYGFVEFAKALYNCFAVPSNNPENDLVIVIKVKNSEETLEAAVRSVIWKCLNCAYGGKIPDILIVDLGSDDATAEIAKKLCDDYSFIYYTTDDLYRKAKGKQNEI